MKNTIVTYSANGTKTVWSPTTLDKIKKDEKYLESVMEETLSKDDKIEKNEQYLESVIAETPELLRLDARKTGVYGPYCVFRQLRFTTPQLRVIKADIVLLSASGGVIVVEVKQSSNPELRDRRVIAQAIDYAASLSALSETELAELFSHGKESIWTSLVNSLFPGDKDPEELAVTLLSNIGTGKIHVVIACDKVPAGLYELAKSVSVQKYLSFSLDVLEITPFLSDNGIADQIMFVPNVRLSTEIVARTAITITDQQGIPLPGVTISTTTIDEIEKHLVAVSRFGGGTKDIWFAVNGAQGKELPALFEWCIRRMREYDAVDVALRKDIDAEVKISQFKNHWRYGDFTTRFEVTTEEWERIFTAIRSAKPMEENQETS